jgi:hypothetical protein
MKRKYRHCGKEAEENAEVGDLIPKRPNGHRVRDENHWRLEFEEVDVRPKALGDTPSAPREKLFIVSQSRLHDAVVQDVEQNQRNHYRHECDRVLLHAVSVFDPS